MFPSLLCVAIPAVLRPWNHMSVKIRSALYDFQTFPLLFLMGRQPFPVNVSFKIRSALVRFSKFPPLNVIFNWTVFFEWSQLRVKTKGCWFFAQGHFLFSYFRPSVWTISTPSPTQIYKFFLLHNQFNICAASRRFFLVLKNTVLGVAQLLHSKKKHKKKGLPSHHGARTVTLGEKKT